jgi:hypothetical protein
MIEDDHDVQQLHPVQQQDDLLDLLARQRMVPRDVTVDDRPVYAVRHHYPAVRAHWRLRIASQQ